MNDHRFLYLKNKIQDNMQLFDKCIENKNYEEAYQYIFRICKLTSFRQKSLNDNFFHTLDILGRPDEALEHLAHICCNLLEENNIGELLYYYQILIFFMKKTDSTKHSTLQGKIKKYFWQKTSEVKNQFSLPPVHVNPQRAKKKKIRIGYLIGLVKLGHAPTKMLLNELKYLNKDLFETSIFTTEWAANWFYNAFQPSLIQSGHTDLNELIKEEYQTPLFIADPSDNFLKRSIRIYRTIIQNNIDILAVNSSDTEAITLIVSMLKPAPYMINVVHAAPLICENTDCVIVTSKDDMQKNLKMPQFHVPLTSDIQNSSSTVSKHESIKLLEKIYELKKSYKITGTFGNLFKINNENYIKTLSKIITKNKNTFHLIAGSGDFQEVKEKFGKDTMDKILYLGFQNNIKPFIEILDVYLASFPYPGCTTELECIALGKPVVSMAGPINHHYNSGASVVGLKECIAPEGDCNSYAKIANSLLQSKKKRSDIGNKLLKRFNKNFSPVVRAKNCEEIYLSLMK